MLIYLFGKVPVGTLPCGMKLGFLEMESLTSHNQFLLGLGINSDNHNSLVYIVEVVTKYTELWLYIEVFKSIYLNQNMYLSLEWWIRDV